MTPQRAVASLMVVLALAPACATPRGAPGAIADAPVGQRPALDTDEAGLWMEVDRLERRIQTSGQLVRDPELNAYLRGILCRVAGPHCEGIRIYVVRNPLFNASMAPNGMMQIFTGALLRMENEAQLAYLLGHEVGHFIRRHSIEAWRDIRAKAAFLAGFQLFVGAAATAAGFGGVVGAGQVGSLANTVAGFATLGSMYAFSRDNEREADDVGLEAVIKAGYEPREAPKIWARLLQERDAAPASTPVVFFATHPPVAERQATLEDRARTAAAGGAARQVGQDELLARTLRYRATWLADELRRRQFASSQILLDSLLAGGVRVGEVNFFQGELHRLRGEQDDPPRAIIAYRKALAHPETPPEIHRNLGLVLLRTGERAQARSAFQQYLEVQPNASDAELIRAQLRELE